MLFLRKCIKASVLLFLGILLSGCGMYSSTSMIINADFSGVRTMKVAYTEGSANDIGEIKLAAIKEQILATTPPELSVIPAADLRSYTVTLSFSNMEDYRSKVQRLIEFNRTLCPDAYRNKFDNYSIMPAFTPEITYIPLADGGVIYKENFTDSDLLNGWFAKAHNNVGIVVTDGEGNTSQSQDFIDSIHTMHLYLNGRDIAEHSENSCWFDCDTRSIFAIHSQYDAEGNYIGSPYAGWSWIKNEAGQWMYCSPDGTPAKNTWVDMNYCLDENGIARTGWYQDPLTGYWYYFLETDQSEITHAGHKVTDTDMEGGHIDSDGVWTAY